MWPYSNASNSGQVEASSTIVYLAACASSCHPRHHRKRGRTDCHDRHFAHGSGNHQKGQVHHRKTYSTGGCNLQRVCHHATLQGSARSAGSQSLQTKLLRCSDSIPTTLAPPAEAQAQRASFFHSVLAERFSDQFVHFHSISRNLQDTREHRITGINMKMFENTELL